MEANSLKSGKVTNMKTGHTEWNLSKYLHPQEGNPNALRLIPLGTRSGLVTVSGKLLEGDSPSPGGRSLITDHHHPHRSSVPHHTSEAGRAESGGLTGHTERMPPGRLTLLTCQITSIQQPGGAWCNQEPGGLQSWQSTPNHLLT